MRYTISFAVFLYVIVAVIDAALGIGISRLDVSYIFRSSAALNILATYLYFVYRNKRFMLLIPVAVSLILSVTAVILGYIDAAVTSSLILKVAAIVLTVKPDIIEVEVVTEEKD
ncbi:hypothetical protein J7L18_09885 [Candidatus Bathyarchaeota archaeon]|nr:hypothetical protein [Candidatus Bathyarchaeota archaeon]